MKTKKELPEFVKYPKIPYINESPELYGREVYIFEKIDGSLSQVRRTEEGILGGTKSNYITGNTTRPCWGANFLKWMHSNSSLYNLKPNIIMFGEWLEPVTVDYDKEMHNKFYFIDLGIVKDGKIQFYDYLEALDYLDEWKIEGIEIMPIIAKRIVDESISTEIVRNLPSYLRILKWNEKNGKPIDCEMEGIVLKNYELERFAKFLHPKYSEIREEAKTLEEKYVNESRIKKAIRRIKDRNGEHVKISLDDLVREVKGDIYSESELEVNPTSIKSIIRARGYL